MPKKLQTIPIPSSTNFTNTPINSCDVTLSNDKPKRGRKSKKDLMESLKMEPFIKEDKQILLQVSEIVSIKDENEPLKTNTNKKYQKKQNMTLINNTNTIPCSLSTPNYENNTNNNNIFLHNFPYECNNSKKLLNNIQPFINKEDLKLFGNTITPDDNNSLQNENKVNENEVNEENEDIKLNEDSEVKYLNSLKNTIDCKPANKKRGRKPKGGKIIQQILSSDNHNTDIPNVILHLKCSMKDLQLSNQSNGIIDSFHFNLGGKTELSYNILQNENINVVNSYNEKQDSTEEIEDEETFNKDSNKEIWKKLKQLEHNLHINNVTNKKSACFWDTCEFDNPAIYIPKYFINGSYHVYGCFCSPECGVAYLMNENIDSSIKFERYHLFNHLYTKIYDYKKNIKPSPNPYYMLEKYYGNLSIQDYRSLLRNERLFLIVDKPLTRILPELHEDNDDFILNNKIIPSNNYQIKTRLQRKKQNKNLILNEKFGINNSCQE
jgi:hypothetical protein